MTKPFLSGVLRGSKSDKYFWDPDAAAEGNKGWEIGAELASKSCDEGVGAGRGQHKGPCGLHTILVLRLWTMSIGPEEPKP